MKTVRLTNRKAAGEVLRTVAQAHEFLEAQGITDVAKEVEKAIEEERIVVPYTISDSGVDRHNDSINVKGWVLEDYNGVVLWAHNHNLPAIGSAIKVWTYGEKLKALKSFTNEEENPFGAQIARMVAAGFIKDASVGMKPIEYKVAEDRDDGESWFPPIDYEKQALLESSVVNVGANPRARAEKGQFSSDALGVLEEYGADVDSFLRNMEIRWEESCSKFFFFRSRQETANKEDVQREIRSEGYEIDFNDLQKDFKEKFNGR